MGSKDRHKANSLSFWKIGGVALLTFLISFAASAQNTKGDKPVSNQRQVRETKFKNKTQKKGKKAKTKDLAGRRLRTKDKSSANRANASYPQPNPYANRPRVMTDRAAKSRGRIFNSSPRESRTQRAWKGDISGSSIRRVRPSKSDAARNYVVNPSHLRYIKHLQKQDRKPPKVYTRTASGSYPVRIAPHEKQRAWKGDMKGNPVSRPRSATGRVKNIYKQSGQYVHNPSRNPPKNENHYGRSGQARFLNYSSPRKAPGRSKGAPASASQGFVKRGKKNVYWGKFSKGEKAYTKDITGGPLRTRNFKSTPAGLVGRDTLKFFGRKPLGDRSAKGKKSGGFVTTRKGQRAWTGDISGSKLRRTKPKTKETAGDFFYPRKLSISKSGEAGKRLPGGGFMSSKRKSRVEKNPLPVRAPGMGATSINKYNGSLKGRRAMQGGGSASRRGWNNNGSPLPVRRGADGRAATYPGSFKQGELAPGFNPQGIGFAGNIKTRRPPKGGGSVSRRQWNNNGNPIQGRGSGDGSARAARFQGNFRQGELTPGFTPQGIGFAGNIKTRRPAKGGGSVSGKIWNNGNEPVEVRRAGSGTIRAARFQGSYKNGELTPGFSPQGIGYAGNIKTRRPAKGGGSVSGKIWNNKNQPIEVRNAGKGIQASQFQGNFKTRRPEKGGGSVSGQSLNNHGQPIAGTQPGKGTLRAGVFQGNIKTKRPEKGGGSVSGQLINNDGKPIVSLQPGRGSVRGSKFQGNLKTRGPVKGGGSVSGQMWNNNEKPIQGEDPSLKDAKMARFTYKEKKPFLKKMYVQNPNASEESIKKAAPDQTTFRVGGLQVKVKEKNYGKKPYGAPGALPGIAPKGPSLKAVEYARSMKRTWDYKHNPNSHAEALDVREAGKANARIGDFQGNIKMSKPSGARLHPDATFVHGKDDNVKEERTILTNFKLFWAKLFKKNDNQPDHLKEKIRRPRYDKREQGMWYN